MKKSIVLCFSILVAVCSLGTDLTVTTVSAQQRYPWNGLVDIAVTIAGSSNDVAASECFFAATDASTQGAISIMHITSNGADPVKVGAGMGSWLRRFVWDATLDVGAVTIDRVVLAVEAKILGGVQLWKDGPYWAECNVGATKPEDYGYYFWWGDTVGYTRSGGSWEAWLDAYLSVTWVSSAGERMSSSPFSASKCPTYGKSISQLQSLGYTDSSGNLVATHDAATIRFGAPWRMPTDSEMAALINNCTTIWTTKNDVYGRLITGKGSHSSKSIFLPAAGDGYDSTFSSPRSLGRYWTSTPNSADSNYAWYLNFTSSKFNRGNYNRFLGQSVRPLRGFGNNAAVVGAGAITTELALDCRAGTRVITGGAEQIRFSPMWETNTANAVSRISINNLTVTNATDEGSYEWFPKQDGTYQFTHIVLVNEDPVGDTLNATFTVNGLNPVITPESGTTFDTSLTVNISCADGATVHFTTNGTTPTIDSPVYKRFKINGKTIVKAIAVFSDGSVSGVTTAEYAKGVATTPIVTPSDGTVFKYSNQEVSIAREGTDGVLRYTLDGSDPTPESEIYTGPFTINETTTVKAKIFGADYLDSAIATSILTREWLIVATPVIMAPTSFSGTKTNVSIVCATEDAVIRYTTDGSEPNEHSEIYEEPFHVTTSCTIKATAFKDDFRQSTTAAITITREWSIGDALNDPDRKFTTDAECGWVCDEIISHDDESSMCSGALTNSAKYGTFVASTIATTVSGKGMLRFWWKASCENDLTWDHGEFFVDGEMVTNICGETDWQVVTYNIETEGDHMISWKYLKDDFGSEGDDCIWLDEFHLTPKYTTTTVVPVPGEWIDRYYPDTLDYEETAKRQSANGINSVEDAYVAGLDPTNVASVFTATIAYSNGMVYVSWTPNLNDGCTNRIYTLAGKTDLETGDWESPIKTEHRFFMVSVEMPTGAAGEKTDVPDKGFVPTAPLGGVQLWENGPYWAECNVGASQPEDYGYYFWWGDTVGYSREGGTWTDDSYYSDVTWVSSTGVRSSSSPFNPACQTYARTTSELQSLGYIDTTGNLVAAHDAATAHLGEPWRMPTSTDIDALINNCDTTWTNKNGVCGRLVTGRGEFASKSIFLPASGYSYKSCLYNPGSNGRYWSSTPVSDISYDAWYLYFDSSYYYWSNYTRYRDYGRPVRPLRDSSK